jgi:hypothetical protein
MSDSELSKALLGQARGCGALGSTFYEALLLRAIEDLACEPLARLFAPWDGRSVKSLFADAVPLRLLGGLHDLVLSGDAPELAAAFPPIADAEAAWAAAKVAIDRHFERLERFMAHEPQTNEVRRSACLLPGFLTVSEETGLPLRCFEIGASAGLNQLWSRFHYDLGAAGTWGDHDSSVKLDTDWRGPPPPLSAPIQVLETAACDRKPMRIADPAERRRLRAYIWPDQARRLARFDAALAMALEIGVQVEAEDAVTWPERRAQPSAGSATVLFHSIFWQYMPSQSQAALTQAIARIGAAATPQAPFAWLRMEPSVDDMLRFELRLTLWPDGQDRLLALTHPHLDWVEWRA